MKMTETEIQQQQESNLEEIMLRKRMEFNFALLNLLFPFIIITAVYFLPFAHLQYHVQKLELNANNGSIEVGAEELSLDVNLFQCLGGICGEQKIMIEGKMAEIQNAGNSDPAMQDPYPMEGENFIIVTLNSLSQGLATVVGDDDNMRDKSQVRVFAYAGMIVIMILLIASTLALISFIVLAVSSCLSQQCKQSATPQKVVSFSREFISCLLLGASIAYPAAVWRQMHISGSSLGSGYIFMAMLTAMMQFRSLIMRGLRKMGEYFCQKRGGHRSVEVSLSPESQEANMII